MRVISAVVASPWTGRSLYGVVVSDDDFAVIPVPPKTEADMEPVVWDYTHIFKAYPQDAEQRMIGITYNTSTELLDYTDEPDGDFQQAVDALTTKISEG